jgi:hypothetical protein
VGLPQFEQYSSSLSIVSPHSQRLFNDLSTNLEYALPTNIDSPIKIIYIPMYSIEPKGINKMKQIIVIVEKPLSVKLLNPKAIGIPIQAITPITPNIVRIIPHANNLFLNFFAFSCEAKSEIFALSFSYIFSNLI